MDSRINENTFYSEMIKRNIGVYTKTEQEKIKNSKVAIFGLGGVGGLDAVLCARSGVGHVSGFDPDTFEVSNINRQILAFFSTLDHSKSVTTEKYLKDINPFLKTNFLNVKVTEQNVFELMENHDVVLEALDDMPSRIIVHRAAQKLGIPSIAMSGSPPNRGFISTFIPGKIDYETALNLKTHGKSLSCPEVLQFVQNIKKQRARYSVSCGASQDWAENFCAGTAGWIITPVRAVLIAAFSCYEALQILIGRKPLAEAPKGIFINLNHLTNPVRVKTPKKGYWEAFQL
jgi:molybdopterin/thiamine biosynthesis adenylyltransferase